MEMLLKFIYNRMRLMLRRPATPPQSQAQLANMVNYAVGHAIRQGYTHRFITLLFVTVGERVFCRRYSYNEPSWHSAFVNDAEGQLRLDKTVVNIKGFVPADLEDINPAVNKAYEQKLAKLGAGSMLAGATEPRALAGTLELVLNTDKTDSS